ncbi:hypothetical protein ACQV2X_08595 [Facklamia sp. P12945]|uniref:hypothetical protein n=1 Tax=unclassified Facklamia TaxID=2622293 RepID=UPI003D164B07
MMKVKSFFNRLVVLLFAVSMLSPIKTHAQINNYFEDFMTEAKPSRKTATELFEEIKIANEKVTSVTENISLYSIVETEDEYTFSQQWALLDLLFDQVQAIKAAILYFETEENDQFYFEETFLPSDEKAVLVRSSKNDQWVNQMQDSSDGIEYFANPNYHLLMDSLVNISDGLQVFENETHYIFLNNGQDINLFDEFQPHFDLYVNGIDSKNFTTDIMVSFDKETLLLKEFSYISYYDKNNEYLEISVNTIMESWNEYHEDMFKKRSHR